MAMARQMPPPAPLISAAFPASCMRRLPSQHHGAAIDRDGLAGDETAGIGDQPQYGAGEIRWLQIALNGLTGLDSVQRTVEFLPEKLAGSLGDDGARRQRIDPDAVAAELARQAPRQADHRRLRG